MGSVFLDFLSMLAENGFMCRAFIMCMPPWAVRPTLALGVIHPCRFNCPDFYIAPQQRSFSSLFVFVVCVFKLIFLNFALAVDCLHCFEDCHLSSIVCEGFL